MDLVLYRVREFGSRIGNRKWNRGQLCANNLVQTGAALCSISGAANPPAEPGRPVQTVDKGEGVQNPKIFVEVIYEWSP